jgi:hypothetical protein
LLCFIKGIIDNDSNIILPPEGETINRESINYKPNNHECIQENCKDAGLCTVKNIHWTFRYGKENYLYDPILLYFHLKKRESTKDTQNKEKNFQKIDQSIVSIHGDFESIDDVLISDNTESILNYVIKTFHDKLFNDEKIHQEIQNQEKNMNQIVVTDVIINSKMVKLNYTSLFYLYNGHSLEQACGNIFKTKTKDLEEFFRDQFFVPVEYKYIFEEIYKTE